MSTNCIQCGTNRRTSFDLLCDACRKPKSDIISRGLRALDDVKHCQEKMLSSMRENDANMRSIPPAEWTEAQVQQAEKTAKFINS